MSTAPTITVRTPAGAISLTPEQHAEKIRRDVERFVRGERPDFSRYETPTGTAFQRKCWAACRSIPYGQTRTYAWLAKKAGSPNAARAAGQAMRRNPLPVVVPCHRVVGSSGWIGGFAGDSRPTGASVDLKRWLLGLEQAQTA
ncbi:MAG: methylated-DNA--[protein]-cysteine S-methyltransferase [Phycisphaerae bacterium]|nr:methylated-DNA--[protein]-cysteine S-methyltransferase [Phycisphaerae bacterium]